MPIAFLCSHFSESLATFKWVEHPLLLGILSCLGFHESTCLQSFPYPTGCCFSFSYTDFSPSIEFTNVGLCQGLVLGPLLFSIDFISSYIHSTFNQYLLSVYYVPDSILGTRNRAMHKQSSCLYKAHILVEEKVNNKKLYNMTSDSNKCYEEE